MLQTAALLVVRHRHIAKSIKYAVAVVHDCERALILIKIHPAQIYYNSTDFFASQLHYTAHIAFVTVSI